MTNAKYCIRGNFSILGQYKQANFGSKLDKICTEMKWNKGFHVPQHLYNIAM